MSRLAFIIVSFFSFGVAGYALAAYLSGPAGATVHPDMRTVYAAHRAGIYTHIFAAAVTLLLGPLQFAAFFRRRYPAWHRVAGKIYLGVGVGVGGAAGLYMSLYAFGGLVSTVGFALLAFVWLYSGVRAFMSARARDFAEHRRWMVRNFACSLAAATLRIELIGGSVAGLPFDWLYPATAWLSWIPNLIVAEFVARREKPEVKPTL